jgi:hypothetical protein
MVDAHNAGDWKGVLALEGTVEALLDASCCDAFREKILGCFAHAHLETCNPAQTAVFKERQIDMLGIMQRFEEQAWAMLQFAMTLQKQGDFTCARKWCEKAREIGKSQGSFATECTCCYQMATQVPLAFRVRPHPRLEFAPFLV